ncbi:DUF4374 domain-containing protein [Fodinibius salsisoli]|uniref:DUF4374 domain-containing protein n=1 Tax=Fodinibius salsisoli TaxID=2820877 RepID=A0ABT3PHP2_9BACT|nr:DUF4374 domain-containing protein [Fodinibius salsisoli]MCW9705441.1 DUF4374 domain-containing protein [Fodinibius salsisoli]
MKFLHRYIYIFMTALLVTSCSDPSSVDSCEESGNFIIAATPQALDGVADYLLTTESLESGSISTVGCGQEQDGTYRYYVTNNNKYFSLLYGQGNPGAVTTYQLNSNGKLDELSDFQSETVQAFAPIEDDVLMVKAPRSINDPTAYWYRLNTENSQFTDEGQIDIIELAGNGEGAFPSWLTQVDDQVFMPFSTITGQGNNSFSTSYPDSAWVAVYSYPEMALQTVIKDDRTSFIGRYFTKGLSVDENGDVYAFSSAIATDDNGQMISTKPSAITRINGGAMEFDQSYFFNIQEASDGFYLTDHVYAGDGNVLLMMRDADEKAPYTTGHNFAIVNVHNQTFTWVNGLPDASSILNVTSMNNYVSEDGSTVYTGITIGNTIENEEGEKETVFEGSYVYAIDIASATATRGLEVKGGAITSINKLEPAE